MHNETHIFFEKKGITFSNIRHDGGRLISKRQFANNHEANILDQDHADLLLKRKKRQQRNRINRVSTTQSNKVSVTTRINSDELEFDLKTTRQIQNIASLPFEKMRLNLTGEILNDSK